MNKNLSYFMRDDSKAEQIIKVPAPERFIDENGNPIEMEIRILSTEQINKINDAYTTKRMAFYNKKPIVTNGMVAYIEERDSDKASRHIIVEALKYPDLKDKAMMDFYKCHDITEMPDKVFPTFDEYKYVSHTVMVALGLVDESDDDDNEKKEKTSLFDTEVADAKNS